MHLNDPRPPDGSLSQLPRLTHPARPTILVNPYTARLHCLLGDHSCLTTCRDIGQLNAADAAQHPSINARAQRRRMGRGSATSSIRAAFDAVTNAVTDAVTGGVAARMPSVAAMRRLRSRPVLRRAYILFWKCVLRPSVAHGPSRPYITMESTHSMR
jgi:hypothetical protein